jgi:acyl-CoA reductase-like NAD-dependent aldehyde dehydrogenase
MKARLNVRLERIALNGATVTLEVEAGRIARIDPAPGPADWLALPLPVDPHVHLDKTFLWPRAKPAAQGLFPAIEAALADRATLQLAIDAAKAAFPAWRNTPPAKRAQIMFRFKQLLEQHEATIAKLISEEHGKTIEDAVGELKRGIENVEFACAAPEILKGEYSRNVGPNIDAWSDMQPLGVVAGITPFNFPAMVPLWMYPLAIVCGNCFILKPSERDPSSTLYIAQLLIERVDIGADGLKLRFRDKGLAQMVTEVGTIAVKGRKAAA